MDGEAAPGSGRAGDGAAAATAAHRRRAPEVGRAVYIGAGDWWNRLATLCAVASTRASATERDDFPTRIGGPRKTTRRIA
jgi:hypothetical protein